MKRNLLIAAFAAVLICGCSGATGARGMESSDPTERGCSYIAAAIVSAAIIRGILNK